MAHDKKSFISGENLSGEEKLFISRTADMTRICSKICSPKFSAFLSEREQLLAEKYLHYEGFGNYMLWGGFENAQRKMLGVFPEFGKPDAADFPLGILRFSWRECDSLSHRDFLGCLMSIGVARNQIGDIVCSEGRAYAVLTPQAAQQAVFLEKAGRVGLKAAYADESDVIERNDKFSEISAAVSSLRLDCIVGAATKLSREKAAALIRSGAVSVNHGTVQSVSDVLSEGDVLSVRGYGRYILAAVGDRTKRDRIHVTVKKYI